MSNLDDSIGKLLLDLQKDDGSFRKDTLSRKESNSKNAAALIAIYQVMPRWYQWVLERKKKIR